MIVIRDLAAHWPPALSLPLSLRGARTWQGIVVLIRVIVPGSGSDTCLNDLWLGA
ncbi:hypothetical protein E2C01_095209 [Portunus trituberculatus]|uniref:Uncharacterized protein n=1 Tax=Portunus trituberculatus TaxID=210409 RepID=A0A5B7K560_PORTR|nr:hypothetical protein [Portunus trituberculatus]